MITYRQERLTNCKPDVEILLPEQWAETGDIGIDCEPVWSVYHALDKVDALVLVMAREEGRPIGYLTGSVYRHPNSSHHMVGSLPTWFVERRPARALIARRLLQAGIDACFQKGAHKVTIKTDFEHSAGRLIEAMGGQPKAIEYVMLAERRYA
jgi:hypothetical protein